jgi:hypothetical protein
MLDIAKYQRLPPFCPSAKRSDRTLGISGGAERRPLHAVVRWRGRLFDVRHPRSVSYVVINTPEAVAIQSTSRSDACLPPGNSRRPVPSTRG